MSGFPEWDALIVPGSKKKGEVWTELEKLRVKSKYSKPGMGITGCKKKVVLQGTQTSPRHETAVIHSTLPPHRRTSAR